MKFQEKNNFILFESVGHLLKNDKKQWVCAWERKRRLLIRRGLNLDWRLVF